MQRHTHTITQLSSDVNGQTCMAGQTDAALQERIEILFHQPFHPSGNEDTER